MKVQRETAHWKSREEVSFQSSVGNLREQTGQTFSDVQGTEIYTRTKRNASWTALNRNDSAVMRLCVPCSCLRHRSRHKYQVRTRVLDSTCSTCNWSAAENSTSRFRATPFAKILPKFCFVCLSRDKCVLELLKRWAKRVLSHPKTQGIWLKAVSTKKDFQASTCREGILQPRAAKSITSCCIVLEYGSMTSLSARGLPQS